MTPIALQAVRKDFGTKEILKNATFSIDPKDKIGLIGVNGSGKSTLLKILAGIEPIDGGRRLTGAAARIAYLPQQPEIDSDRTVLEQVMADSSEQTALVREYEDLSRQLARAEGDAAAKLSDRLSRVSDRAEATGAWELETRAKIVLSELGIQDVRKPIGQLSGGYRKRVALATALLSRPDLLLLDEPTNHLDALSVEWLQGYLNRYAGALLLVTHDRYFLDRVTNRILEIDCGDVCSYGGNYRYYLQKKAEAEEAAASSRRKHFGVLRRELEWLKRGPKARSTKQKARIDRIRDMQNTEFKEERGKVELSAPGRRIGKKVVHLFRVCKSYGDRLLLDDFSYRFHREDRVGIIGPNGIGKSTLVNIVAGRDRPDSGTVETGATICIGYFDQHSQLILSAIEENQRVIDYLREEGEYVAIADGTKISVSQMLERFLFSPAQQHTPLYKLSGGEKRRLFLLRILLQAPNVLILDEPTNDLDVQTLAVLEDYLEDFNGCVIVVSHDRYFLDRTVDKIFAFETAGKLREYPGNYSLYLEYKQREETEEKERSQQQKPPKKAEKAPRQKSNDNKPRKLSYKEKRELENLEVRVPELEAEKEAIENTLYKNPPSDFEALQKLSEKLAALEMEIDRATERWMELAEVEEK